MSSVLEQKSCLFNRTLDTRRQNNVICNFYSVLLLTFGMSFTVYFLLYLNVSIFLNADDSLDVGQHRISGKQTLLSCHTLHIFTHYSTK